MTRVTCAVGDAAWGKLCEPATWRWRRTPVYDEALKVKVEDEEGRGTTGLSFCSGWRLSLNVRRSSLNCTGWKRRIVTSTKVSAAPLMSCIAVFKSVFSENSTPLTDVSTSPHASLAKALPFGRTCLITGRPTLGPWPTLSTVTPMP